MHLFFYVLFVSVHISFASCPDDKHCAVPNEEPEDYFWLPEEERPNDQDDYI
jgi:hypothetical protein